MNANEILELAQHLDSEFGAQQKEDDRIAQLLQRKAGVQSGQPVDPNDPVKRIGSGHPGLAVNQAFSLLTKPPFLRVNSPKNTQDKHAEKLENGLLGLWLLSSGSVSVWLDMVYDFVWAGRGIVKVCYYPQMWKDYKPGEYDTEEEVKADNERMMRLKEGNCPIITRYIDPRNCRRTTTLTGETDLVTERLKLPVRAAKKAYPNVDFKDMTDKAEVEVIHYADSKRIQTIVLAGKDAQETEYDFEHDLGVNPYVYAVAPKTSPSDEVEFRGVLYHTKDLFDAEEQLFSDAMYNIRQSIASAYKLVKNANFQDDGIDPAGQQRKIEIGPRKVVDNLKPGEDLLALEAARTNIDVFALLDRFGAMINSVAIQPVLFGALQSGQSGTLFNTAAQFAQNQYGPATEQLEKAAEAIGKRLFRCVEVFGEDIPIYYTNPKGDTYSLTLSPKDVQGWEHRIQARISLAIPQNENAEIEKFKLAVDPTNPLMAWETAAGRWGGIENPVEEWERIANNQIDRALMADIIQLVRSNFLGELQNPSEDLTRRIGQLPPAIQEALAIYTNNAQTGGQLARTNANTIRAGQPQNQGVPGGY